LPPLFLRNLNFVSMSHKVLILKQFHYLPLVINVYKLSH
jgi:hypothetical protein